MPGRRNEIANPSAAGCFYRSCVDLKLFVAFFDGEMGTHSIATAFHYLSQLSTVRLRSGLTVALASLPRTRLYRSRTLARPEDLESPRSSESERDELGGVLMTVCKDCKAMVLHIIGTWKKRRDRSKRASAPARPRSLFIAAVR